ncbi:hypothetical protein BgiBS90_018934 [Biomphalaria glabrata]|nr:hypothetical protein BgiBS90_018934 [Biomphalaria glabrata]
MGLVASYFTNKLDRFYGQHEVDKFSGEAEISCLPEDCKKSKGHKDMIPVYEFTKDHLPERYRDEHEIYKLAQSIAYLTVRLRTSFVSKKRPRYLPKTNYDYPLFESRGESCMNTGSGRVCDVVRNTTGSCSCKKCKDSGNPSKLWWTIKIFTATHVVYDKDEAEATTCTLFFEGKESNRKRVDFDGCKKIWLDVSGDLCLLETPTCDETLAKELFAEIKQFNVYWKSLKKKYQNDEEKEKLIIIVSHPHGQEKRISVGLGLDIGKQKKLGYSKFIYTTPTCPGTSGGPVYVLGYDWFKTEYVHGGAILEPISDSDSSSDSEGAMNLASQKLSDLFPSYDESSVMPLSYSSIYIHTDNSENYSLDNSSIQSLQSGEIQDLDLNMRPESSNDSNYFSDTQSHNSAYSNDTVSDKRVNANMKAMSLATAMSNSDIPSDSISDDLTSVSNADTTSSSKSKFGKYFRFSNYSARWY